MTKTKDFDCVEMKRRAQEEILKELEGHSPEEQYKILRRLAEETPTWQKLRKAKKTAPRSAAAAKQRNTG